VNGNLNNSEIVGSRGQEDRINNRRLKPLWFAAGEPAPLNAEVLHTPDFIHELPLPTREMNMNGAKGTRYTDQDYADIRHGMDVLKDDLRGKNAAEQARDLKNWLAMHRPAFVRQWKSIMSHMGPPGVDTAHQKDGVITRARHARNLEEARANLEARRAQDAHLTLQEKGAEETEKKKVLQKEIESLLQKDIELKAMLEEKQVELAKVNNNCSHLEKQTDAAAKEAKDKMNEAEALRKELDAKETEVERANERAAEAERVAEEQRERAEEQRERAEQAEKAKRDSDLSLRRAQLAKQIESKRADELTSQKRQLIQCLSSSDRDEERKKICLDNQLQQIESLQKEGDMNAVEEMLEEMERQVIVHPQSSGGRGGAAGGAAGAGSSGDAH
jgi:hypothetical protein